MKNSILNDEFSESDLDIQSNDQTQIDMLDIEDGQYEMKEFNSTNNSYDSEDNFSERDLKF